MIRSILLSLFFLTGANIMAQETSQSVYDFKVQNIEGKQLDLSIFKGKVLLIANTASNCGYTPQYAGLQELYEKYKEQGLVVLGFPSNDFGAQEPGTNEEIVKFCSATYEVTFPLFSKGPVSGQDKQELFAYLTENSPEPGEIKWNFEKFLVGRNGQVQMRYRSNVSPTNSEVIMQIEILLTEPAN